MSALPRVTLGMPVYNGAAHVAEAIESIRAQTFRDFELLIFDNASTDDTEAICRELAGRDDRIRYHRNEANLGAARNFNSTFEIARGEYFKWAAHDDVIAPTYLERCAAALDATPRAVLSFPRRRYLSYDGARLLGSALEAPAGVSTEPSDEDIRGWERVESLSGLTFADLLRLAGSWFPVFVFGLIRSSALRHTSLIEAYGGSDIVLVGQLRLLGEFVEVPEELYFQRLHPSSGWTHRRTRLEEARWYDPRAGGPVLPHRLKLYVEFLRAIRRTRISWPAKMAAYRDVAGRLSEALARRVFSPPGPSSRDLPPAAKAGVDAAAPETRPS